MASMPVAGKAATEAARAPAAAVPAAAPATPMSAALPGPTGAIGNRALAMLLQAGSASVGARETAADAAAALALDPRSALGASDRARSVLNLPPATHAVPAHVHKAWAGGGEPLPAALCEPWQETFGADLRAVRVHRGEHAAASAARLGALAYASGNRIVLGAGQWRPGQHAGQALLAHEVAHLVQQRVGRAERGALHLKPDPAAGPTLLEVDGETFDEAAANFAAMLAQRPKITKARMVLANGPNLKVYDEKGKPLGGKFFHLNTPTFLPIGVFGRSSKGAAMHAIEVLPDGQWRDGGTVKLGGGTIDFRKDVDDQEGFDKLLNVGAPVFYVSPNATGVPPQSEVPTTPQKIENLPEFMQFEAKTKANLPAWPSATVPATPQLATVNSTGTFICRVNKDQGAVLIDRVTNLMQPTQFRWEVLKLDTKLQVQGKRGVDFWDGAKEGYSRRFRNLEDDRQAMLGNRKRQSVPESVFRAAMQSQIEGPRTALAVVGQTVATFINAVTGGPNQLSTEDAMDVPWKEQGDYFVRCLATQVVPKDAKYRRATSVSGVMVSVYDIEDVARDGLMTADDLRSNAQEGKASVQSQIDALDARIAAGKTDPVAGGLKRAMLAIDLAYQTELEAAGTDPVASKVAEQTMTSAKIAFVKSSAYPAGEPYASMKATALPQLEAELKKIEAVLGHRRGALKAHDDQIEPVDHMRAVLVDELTSAKTDLVFAVGERRFIAAGNLEVVIADITGAKGRVFSGSGSGAMGEGRQDAWLDALTDLRRNLNRGRGYLAYQVPKRYQPWKSELPNPMKLEMSLGAQVKETVDDAAHALTIAAILAAPFTGGASLSILAVLAPIQAASSLYNIVNRAAYNDLELDQEAVFDLINIATLGLSKASTVGKVGSRSLNMVATSSKVAIKLIAGGQFIVVSFETFQTLMEEGDPNADPREIRRKKLMKLLNWCEQAAIPVAEKLYAEAHGPGRKPAKVLADERAGVSFEEPLDVKGRPRKATVQEGGFVEPAVKSGAAEVGAKPVAEGGNKPVAGDAARPLADAGAATPPAGPGVKPAKAQLRGVPKSLQGKVAVVEGLGKDARVAYKRGKNGLITDVQIQIGERASAADVRAHAEVATMMLKYSGLAGRIRVLWSHFTNLFAGGSAVRAEVGSRAWEARLELFKLDKMMRERHEELAALADKPAAERDAARQAELMRDLDSLELQFQEHAEVFNAIEMGTAEGRGYVAAEGLAAGETQRQALGYPETPPGYRWRFRKGRLEVVADPGKPKRYFNEAAPDNAAWHQRFPIDKRAPEVQRFDAGTTRRQAFRELGGYDKSTSFGAFVDVLLQQGVIESRQQVIDAMGEPANRSHDTVRGGVKEGFRDSLVQQMTRPASLKRSPRYKQVVAAGGSQTQALRAAAMHELTRVSALLDSADRGSLGERVYQQMFGSGKSLLQIDVTPAQLSAATGMPEADVPKGRRIDRGDSGNTAREVKNVSSRMGAEQRGEINDMVAMIGSEVTPAKGKPMRVDRVAVAILDPLGGKANASFALEMLELHAGADLTFEFHARDGRIIKVNHKNRQLLADPQKFAVSLGLSD